MAINFELVRLRRPALFGARLSGTVGRAEKERLNEFAAKCLVNGKHHVILDLSELDSVGGGAATLFAGFQRDLTARGGEAVFVGVSDVVRRFLALQFGEIPFRNFPDVNDAEIALAAARAVAAPDARAPEETAPAARPGGRSGRLSVQETAARGCRGARRRLSAGSGTGFSRGRARRQRARSAARLLREPGHPDGGGRSRR